MISFYLSGSEDLLGLLGDKFLLYGDGHAGLGSRAGRENPGSRGGRRKEKKLGSARAKPFGRESRG
jgi:hypothetical protein